MSKEVKFSLGVVGSLLAVLGGVVYYKYQQGPAPRPKAPPEAAANAEGDALGSTSGKKRLASGPTAPRLVTASDGQGGSGGYENRLRSGPSAGTSGSGSNYRDATTTQDPFAAGGRYSSGPMGDRGQTAGAGGGRYSVQGPSPPGATSGGVRSRIAVAGPDEASGSSGSSGTYRSDLGAAPGPPAFAMDDASSDEPRRLGVDDSVELAGGVAAPAARSANGRNPYQSSSAYDQSRYGARSSGVDDSRYSVTGSSSGQRTATPPSRPMTQQPASPSSASNSYVGQYQRRQPAAVTPRTATTGRTGATTVGVRPGSAGYSTANPSDVGDGVPTRERTTAYRVEPRDTFWMISKKVYGSGAYYRALYEYNKNDYPQASALRPGDLVATPEVATLRKTFPDMCPPKGTIERAEERLRTVSAGSRVNGGTPGMYVVEKGDSLFDIARYELGSAARWTEIYELNKEALGDDVNLLKPGMQLRMPGGGSIARQPGGVRSR